MVELIISFPRDFVIMGFMLIITFGLGKLIDWSGIRVSFSREGKCEWRLKRENE